MIAPLRFSVWALAVSSLSWVAAAGRARGVHGTETGCSQGHEHLRMIGHGGGDVVMAAAQARVDELPGIPRVQVRTRGADDRSPVVAAREHLMFTAELVRAGEMDRVGAEPHRFDPLPPGVESCRAGS